MNSNEANQTPNAEAPKDQDGSRRCHGHHGGRRRFIKIPFIIAAIVLVKSAVIMLLWNELIPDLFHAPMISYLQAIELTVLAKLLLGFGHGHHRFGGMMRHRMGHKFAHMSPEERERFKAELKKRW